MEAALTSALQGGDFAALARALDVAPHGGRWHAPPIEWDAAAIERLAGARRGGPAREAALLQMVREHNGALRAASRLEAYRAEGTVLATLLSQVLSAETACHVPLIKVVCRNVHILARRALEEQQAAAHHRHAAEQAGGAAPPLEDAARLLARAFTATITDRAPLERSKKWATLAVANLLFRSYAALGTVRLSANIVRAIETMMAAPSDFPPLAAFPKAEAVTFAFYRARLLMNASKFKEAQEHLEWASSAIPPPFARQARQVMIYLVVLRMIHGLLPRDACLAAHGLAGPFGALTQAIKSGDLRLFDQALIANQAFYMKMELFLVIQLHLRNLILRSFVKKV